MKRIAAVVGVAAVGITLAACSSGGSGTTTDNSGRGPITYVQGKDNSNIVRPLLDKWNAAHPKEKVTFKEQSDKADQQHDDLVQHFQAKDKNYDVVAVDVVWTAEFAAKGWLTPLEGDLKLDTSKLLPATVTAATYNDKLYAAPETSDGGMLYYRTDLVKTPPKTWAEMMDSCSIAKTAGIDCYAGQFQKYEGLTVNASEAINGAGGSILNKSGQPDVDQSGSKTGLDNLVQAFKDGNIPATAITYDEEAGRNAFQSGKLMYLRNWPYVYGLATTDKSSQIVGKYAVAPLPGVDGVGASTLGGHSWGVSAYSEHKATAHDFLEFMLSDETQKFFATQGSLAPVVESLYDDEELQAKLPYLPTLKESILSAVPRPVTPFYPGVTKAIQDNSYAALKGDKSVDEALKDMESALKSATSS